MNKRDLLRELKRFIYGNAMAASAFVRDFFAENRVYEHGNEYLKIAVLWVEKRFRGEAKCSEKFL